MSATADASDSPRDGGRGGHADTDAQCGGTGGDGGRYGPPNGLGGRGGDGRVKGQARPSCPGPRPPGFILV